jgi:hypothetical protein
MEQIAWMDNYTRTELIHGLKNMVFPTRARGKSTTIINEVPVIRTESMTGEKYEYLLRQHISIPKIGTDMSRHQLTIDNKKYSWAELKRQPIGLLKYKAFRAGLSENDMEGFSC